MSPPRSAVDPEAAQVAEWRRDRLLAAGFAPHMAADLAEDSAIDLHALLELVDRGCPPALAARILAPLDRPGPRRSQDGAPGTTSRFS